jgi:formamidopyrimidine-DNA glycosylase
MPELPEVETVLRGLVPHVLGRPISRAEAFTPKLRVPVPPDFSRRLRGRRFARITRRAKYLRFHIDRGPVMLLHLGMSGSLRVSAATPGFRPAKHDHLLWEFEGGKRLVFNDPRRFGLVAFAASKDLESHPYFRGLGVEPLAADFSGPKLQAALHGRSSAIKLALLDQKVVAGLGNIYVSEALFRARVHPKRAAASLSPVRAGALARAIKEVLGDAIVSGGSSLRNHSGVEGELGYFQHRFRVYERDGERCVRKGCRGRVRRIVQGARSTYYCPACQR